MSKKNNGIANDIALLNDVFERLRAELNEMKLEGKLNHDDVSILPFTIGMMQETMRAFIESREPNSDAAKKVIAKQLKSHISDIIPWKEFLRLAGE